MSLFSLLGIGVAQAATDAATTATTAMSTAADNTAHHANSMNSMILMLVVFVAVFYFLLLRPQSKRAKEHKRLMDSLAIGDEVVTAGGVLGRISQLRDSYIQITIANNVNIIIQKSSISAVLPKGTIEGY